MTRRIALIGLFLISIASLWLTTVIPALAVGTVTIIGSNVGQDSIQPVNITSKGITFSITANPQSANATCWPIQKSINSSTVVLSNAGDSRTHPLYTVSWSKNSETASDGSNTVYYSKFSLSIPQTGYELKPHTEYELKLLGGPSGIEFSCQDESGATSLDNFFLPHEGYNIKFTTGPDDVAPIILDQPKMQLNTHNAAAFGWITSEPAKAQIKFGTSINYGTTKSVPGVNEKHIIELNDLQPGTKYYYQLQSIDADGTKTATESGSFTTWGIGPINIQDITRHEATIMWSANTELLGSVIYSESANSLWRTSKSDVRAINHDFRLVQLRPNTTYYAKVKLEDNLSAVESNVFTFKTSEDTQLPNLTIDPQFSSQFDLSNFNFKDFPEEVLSQNDTQSSSGAILAATDREPASIAGNFGSIVEQHRWAIWLWVPVMLLLFLIGCIWLLHRHQNKAHAAKQQILKHKSA